MPRTHYSESVFPFGQQIIVHFNVGAEQMLRTAAALTARQIAISRGLMQGGIEDFARLAQVRSPEGLIQVQADIARRQSDRALAGLQAMIEELSKRLSETAQFVYRVNTWH